MKSPGTREGFIALPKVGADFGERTVIRTFPDGLVIFGKRVNGVRNCGAWFTDAEEWNEYVASLWEMKPSAEAEDVA